jgi:hypothetical protein
MSAAAFGPDPSMGTGSGRAPNVPPQDGRLSSAVLAAPVRARTIRRDRAGKPAKMVSRRHLRDGLKAHTG